MTNRQIRSNSETRPRRTSADMIASLRLPFAGRVSGRDGMIVWMRDGDTLDLERQRSAMKGQMEQMVSCADLYDRRSRELT